MIIENYIFLLFSVLSLTFSLSVISTSNPIYSILSLVLTFLNTAGLLILLGAEFLALLFIIVYIGAVAVLFLFIIMMLNIKFHSLTISILRYIPIFIFFSCIFLFGFAAVFSKNLSFVDVYNINDLDYLIKFPLNPVQKWLNYLTFVNNINIIGSVIYTDFFYPFILSGIILLISMLGAISLTLHRRNDIKKQHIHKQIERNFKNAVLWRS
uniref:NADH dehydrogenase subunit 6 n=1 Tax=Cryptomonas gyropyrenoidosa TaxID=233257 RepID=UPI0027A7CF82|nr:NADH dehydrogenase subunit 6 [Cryptomonas gyropyrenoidosa]WFQ82711.1 NADH dehydrogenase subunit 6 [Cryptomonas gyropyrenoidosa]